MVHWGTHRYRINNSPEELITLLEVNMRYRLHTFRTRAPLKLLATDQRDRRFCKSPSFPTIYLTTTKGGGDLSDISGIWQAAPQCLLGRKPYFSPDPLSRSFPGVKSCDPCSQTIDPSRPMQTPRELLIGGIGNAPFETETEGNINITVIHLFPSRWFCPGNLWTRTMVPPGAPC